MSFGTSFALTSRPLIMGRKGAVVAGHHLAAQAGLDALRAGGNAVDAAIAVASALAVLKPDACATGGDIFMLFAEARTGKVYALNASGPAPRLATREALAGGIPEHGLRAASVPGAVEAWERAVSRFGRRSLRDALSAAAIGLARDGFPVSALFASTLEKNLSLAREHPSTFAAYYPGGRAPQGGEIFAQPELAATLETIARDGAAAFYQGPFADALDRYARETGGLLRREDLAGYQSEWREPLSGSYRGYELIGQPPVSVGLAVLETMQILESFAITAEGIADLIHLQVEAM